MGSSPSGYGTRLESERRVKALPQVRVLPAPPVAACDNGSRPVLKAGAPNGVGGSSPSAAAIIISYGQI